MNIGSPTISLARQLQNGIVKLGYAPDELPVDRYLSYIDLLLQWNKAYNLTGVKQPGKIVTHHILDSLSVLPYVKGNHCLDIGTGAGLPGLILALARPEQQWKLLDSNGKKIRFLNQAIIDLGINNVETINCRIESYVTNTQHSTIIARAWGKLKDLYIVAAHLLQKEGSLLAMKGTKIESELHDLGSIPQANVHQYSLDVPGVESQRKLIEITVLPSCN